MNTPDETTPTTAGTPTPRTPTPRTNEYANNVCREGIDWHYSATRMADFARTLERELTAAILDIGRLNGVIDAVALAETQATNCAVCGQHKHTPVGDGITDDTAALQVGGVIKAGTYIIPRTIVETETPTPRTRAAENTFWARYENDDTIQITIEQLKPFVDEMKAVERELVAEKRAHQSLREQLENYKSQWKRHYSRDAEVKAQDAFDAIHRIADLIGLDGEYNATLVAESAFQRLTAANARIAGLERDLENAENEAISEHDDKMTAIEDTNRRGDLLTAANARIAELEDSLGGLYWHITNGKLSKPYDFKAIESEIDDAIGDTVRDAVKEANARELALRQALREVGGLQTPAEGSISQDVRIGYSLAIGDVIRIADATLTQPPPPVVRREVVNELVSAAAVLVETLRTVHADPAYQGAWQLSQAHFGPYRGPTYTHALASLEAALARWKEANLKP